MIEARVDALCEANRDHLAPHAFEMYRALARLVLVAGEKKKAGYGDPLFDAYYRGNRVLDAIATEARRAETPQSGSVHEGAGRQASPKGDQHD